jgi:hypothetical protein
MKTLQKFLTEVRIAARFPTGKKNADNPYNPNLKSDLPTAQRNRKSFEHNMDVLRDSSVYQDIDKRELEGLSHDEVAEKHIEHYKKNILHIHDNMSEEKRNAASGWYDGAHKIAQSRYEMHRRQNNALTPEGVAGVYAALSPGNEWNNNIALGDRTMDIYHNKKHEQWSPEMESTAKRIWKPKHQSILNDIRGKSLAEIYDMSPHHKAMWIRTYDEAHNGRAHDKYHPSGQPTGEKGTSTRWQSLDNISKAVRSIESGGDMDEISRLYG